jgi:DNA-binding IclR family transcriptional regulator
LSIAPILHGLVRLRHPGIGVRPNVGGRLLSTLIEHGLVACNESARTYQLGCETALLGWSAARDDYDLREVAQESMEHLASESGVTAVLDISGYGKNVPCRSSSFRFPYYEWR